MNCPLCSKEAPEHAMECPACGAIFEKLRQRQSRQGLERKRIREGFAKSSGFVPPALSFPSLQLDRRQWINIFLFLGILAAALLVRYCLGLIVANRRLGPVAHGDTVPLREPATGKVIKVNVHVTSASPKPALPTPAPPVDAAAPAGTPQYDPDFDD